MNCEHGEDAPTMPTMAVSSAIKRMYENRIAELEKAVMSALESNTKARNLIMDGKLDDIESILLNSHTYLLIAANTVHAVKEYSPCLEIKSSKA